MLVKEREMKYIDPTELVPYRDNPRDNSGSLDLVVESIKEVNFTSPIVVDEDYVILAGHTRREAAIELGLDRVPYIMISGLTEPQKRAYRIRDNKSTELSIWDEEKLKRELDKLIEEDYDLDLTGFTEIDLSGLMIDEPELDNFEEDEGLKEEKTTLPMLRFGSNSVRITQDELIMLSNRYNEYVETEPGEGFIVWLLKRGL